MDIRILGPFGVFDNGKRLEISPAKMSGLYVATVATTEELRASHSYIAQRLWPTTPPDNLSGRLRQYAGELRLAAPRLVPERNEKGYCRLSVPRDNVDYLRFIDLMRAAREKGGQEKIETLRAALDQWHDDPLEDVTCDGFAADKARLLNDWLIGWSTYLDAQVQTGHAAEALQEITEPLMRWPDSERLFKIKVDALRISDGPAGVKRALDEWIGDGRRPSSGLMEYCNAPLTITNGLARPHRPVVLQQLMANRPVLVGRTEQYAELDRLLLGSPPQGARLVVLTGMPGVGKTATAMSWAAKAMENFSDGILCAELNGHAGAGPKPPEQELAEFLHHLDVEPSSPSREGMIAAYRSSMAKRNMLVVLDDARDAQQVRPLLPGPGACAVLITSRGRLDGLAAREGAHIMHLEPLAGDEAVKLLAEEGLIRLSTDSELVGDIAEFCGALPLALVVAGALLKNRVFGDLWQTRNALRDSAARLGHLRLHGDDDLNLETAFTTSYRVLSDGAQRLFWHLAVHPGPTISRVALYVLEGETGNELRLPALEELRAANLLDEPVDDRYALHDLTRRFAERQETRAPADERREVAGRAFDFLMHNAWACDRVLVPGRVLPIDAPAGFVIVAPSSVTEAMEWFTAEYQTLVRTVDRTAELTMHRHTWLLAMTLVTYQWRTNKYTDAVRTLRSATAAAEAVAAPGEQAMVHRMLGGTYRGLSDYPKAKWHATAAVRLAREGGNRRGVALSQNALAILNRESGDLAEAAELFAETLARFRELDDPLGEAGALNGLGCIRLSLGDHATALDYCDAAARLFATTMDINGHANALVNRGRTHLARGEYDLAASDLHTALTSYRNLSYPRNEAKTLLDFADSLVALQRTNEAREMLVRAQSLFSELQEPSNEVAERIRRLG